MFLFPKTLSAIKHSLHLETLLQKQLILYFKPLPQDHVSGVDSAVIHTVISIQQTKDHKGLMKLLATLQLWIKTVFNILYMITNIYFDFHCV